MYKPAAPPANANAPTAAAPAETDVYETYQAR
jgi:hypothetical protein